MGEKRRNEGTVKIGGIKMIDTRYQIKITHAVNEELLSNFFHPIFLFSNKVQKIRALARNPTYAIKIPGTSIFPSNIDTGFWNTEAWHASKK
jgi:hypothetical protein